MIVNITDIHADRPLKNFIVYSVAKAGLVGLTRSLARELAPEIRVNAVSPGWVDTDMSASALRDDAATREEIEATIPLRRIATADDCAGPILFLASPLARHVTGEVLNVNGGSVLNG